MLVSIPCLGQATHTQRYTANKAETEAEDLMKVTLLEKHGDDKQGAVDRVFYKKCAFGKSACYRPCRCIANKTAETKGV